MTGQKENNTGGQNKRPGFPTYLEDKQKLTVKHDGTFPP